MRPQLPIVITIAEDGGSVLQPISNVGLKQDGVELRLTDWDGWDDTADVRANPVDIPMGDGAYDDGPLFGARTIQLKGVALSQDAMSLIEIGRTLRRLLTGGIRRGSIAVVQGDGNVNIDSLMSSIRLGGVTTFKKTLPTRADFTMSLYAADPRRYSIGARTATTGPFVASGGLSFDWSFPLTFGGSGTAGIINVVNGGDIPTGVLLEISGECVNPQIALIETGERLALIDSIDADVVIDTNTRNRSVLRNGEPYGWVLTSDSKFFQLPVGNSTLLFRVDSGHPTLTATWSDATP